MALVVWTRNEVYELVSRTGNSSIADAVLLATGNNSTNFTSVAVVDDIVYFADYNEK